MWQEPYDSYQGNHDFLMDPWLSMQWHQQTHWQNHWASHWMDGGYGVGSSSSTDTAVQPQETRNNEQDTIARLEKIKDELELAAWTKLQNALNIALQNEFATELSTCIERAIFFFDYQGADSTPRGAVDALRQTTQALEMCGQGGALYTELDAAAKKVRDTLSVRTQLAALPMGDKKRYQSVLEHAYGGRIDDEENSRLMQSYRKTIWEQFEEAFPSNNKKENIQRGGPRARRERVGRPPRNPPPLEAEGPATIAVRPPPGLEIGYADER